MRNNETSFILLRATVLLVSTIIIIVNKYEKEHSQKVPIYPTRDIFKLAKL